MKQFAWILATFLLSSARLDAESVLLCGQDEVFEIDVAAAEKGEVRRHWSWRAKDCVDLPEMVRGRFATTDECKPIDGGKRVLISSSSGGCALVERPTGRVLWHAVVPNAHSLELLPRERIVVAASVHPRGNRLLLYNIAMPNEPIWEAPLPSAHGVIWDEARKRLWALGFDELQCYETVDWESKDPLLKLESTQKLLDEGGHDLQSVPGSDNLIITTHEHVSFFDRTKRQFHPHSDLGDRAHVKGVSIHPRTDRTVFVQATDRAWWSDSLGFLTPTGDATLPGQRFYKARWLP